MYKSDTLVVGVIFPSIVKYLSDYINSLNSQTESNFDLLLIEDNVFLDDYQSRLKDVKKISLTEYTTPAEIRAIAIKYCLDNDYVNIIFTDTDDYYSPKRVELSKIMLEDYDFVFNEISIVNEEKKIIKENYLKSINVNLEYNNVKEILNRNIFGLSNTAIAVNKLNDFYIPKAIIAADWWIFTLILLNNSSGRFIENALTYYRQTDNNLVGALKKLDKNRLSLGIKVKKTHYKNLVEYCERYSALRKHVAIFNEEYKKIEYLENHIQDEHFLNEYLNVINENITDIDNGWWSEILTLDQWRKYA